MTSPTHEEHDMNGKLICALAMIASSAPAFADHGRRHDGVDTRQQQLEQRIEQGRRSGDLTRHEYARLRNDLRLIARDEHAFRADGHLSQRERQHLHARLETLARAVRYERHDNEQRGDQRHGYYNDGHYADRRF
jgi:chromosome segregation ATPase